MPTQAGVALFFNVERALCRGLYNDTIAAVAFALKDATS